MAGGWAGLQPLSSLSAMRSLPMSDSLPEDPPPDDLSNSANFNAAGQMSSLNQRRAYTAQFNNLEVVRQFVGDAAHKAGLDDAGVYAAQLAVDEAFTNIIEHAYGGESLEKIECCCEVSEAGLTITLYDCGKPFNLAAVPSPNLDTKLKYRHVGGLGLHFIRELMDEVEFTSTPQRGTDKLCNRLRMVKLKEK